MPEVIPDMLLKSSSHALKVETKLTISADWYDFYGKQILNKHAGAFDEIARLTDNHPLFDLMYFDFSTVIRQ